MPSAKRVPKTQGPTDVVFTVRDKGPCSTEFVTTSGQLRRGVPAMGEWWDVPRQDRRTNDRDFWIELTRDRYRTQAGRSASSNGSDRGRVGTVGRLSARARATGRPDPGLPIPSRGRKPDRPSAVGGGRETGPAKPLDPPSRPERGARPRGGPQEDPAGDAPSAGPRLQHLPARRPLHRPDAGRRDPVRRRRVRPERPRQT